MRDKTGETRHCLQCNAAFYALKCRPKNKFCSVACHTQHQTGERFNITCAFCEKLFIAGLDHGNMPKYCSRECRDASAVFMVCAGCGKTFRVSKGKYFREHRLVAANVLGRPLQRAEIVIHLEPTTDNSPSNLYIFSDCAERNNTLKRGIRPKVSNLEPLTYQKPNSRGQTEVVQEDFKPEPMPPGISKPVPPSGPWHRRRKKWIDEARLKDKTRGTPHPKDAPKSL